VDITRIPPAGDPFTSAPAHPSREEKLAKLEERYAHELLDADEREELRERILRLRRRVSEVEEAKERADFHARVAKAQGHRSFRNYRKGGDAEG
jgi:hypothetical protein